MPKIPLTVRIDPAERRALQRYAPLVRRRTEAELIRDHLRPLLNAALDFVRQERQKDDDAR